MEAYAIYSWFRVISAFDLAIISIKVARAGITLILAM